MLPIHFTTGIYPLDVTISVATSVIVILLATRVFTEARYWLQSRGSAGRFQGREPLTLPYTIPWIGGALRITNAHAMYRYAQSMSPHDRPVRLRAGPLSIYVLHGPKNIKMIFKNSKVLDKAASSLMIFRNQGMSQQDMDIFINDHSGWGAQPKTDVPESARVWKRTHDLGAKDLANGHSVNMLTNTFIDQFVIALDKEPLNKTYTTPLYEFFKKAMFVASTTSLVGSEIFKMDSDLTKTYWEFDEGFLATAIGLPRFLVSKQYASTERMLDACKKWINRAWENFDEKDENADWEKNFGSSYTRKMIFTLEDTKLSRDGQAIAMLPMIWAINSNAIPCIIWILLEALKRPGMFQRLREEVAPSMKTDNSGKLTIDIPSLLANSPLLYAMYLETLRACTSSTVTRRVAEDTECDGYILKAGSHIMSPSWLPAHGPMWDVPGHPANQFWPERFIEMPKQAPANPDEKTAYETAMRPENFFPYGGGNVICSGRFFAKQEIMSAVAIFVTKFDIEFQGWVTLKGKTSNREARPDETLAGAGVLPPDRDMMVSVRRIS